jgi:hypothetical protein
MLASQQEADTRAAEEAGAAAVEQLRRPRARSPTASAGLATKYPVGGLPKEIFGRTEVPPSQVPLVVHAKPLPYIPHKLAPITGMPRRFTERPRWSPPPLLAPSANRRSGSTSPIRSSGQRLSNESLLRSVSHLSGPQQHPAIAALQALVQRGEGRLTGRSTKGTLMLRASKSHGALQVRVRAA